MICRIPTQTALATTGRFLAAPCITVPRFYSTATATATATKPPKTSTPAPTTVQLTYTVQRTRSEQLPVYQEKKSGGTRKLTVIRKVVGNAQDLKNHIIQDFKFHKDDVTVNPVTQHVVIKGFHVPEIVNWLEARGI